MANRLAMRTQRTLARLSALSCIPFLALLPMETSCPMPDVPSLDGGPADSPAPDLPGAGYQTMRLYYQGGYGDPEIASKQAHAANRFALINTGMGQTKLAALKAANSATRIIRYHKIGGVRGPVGSGCCKASGSNCIDSSFSDWPLWQAVSTNDLFWRNAQGQVITNPESEGYNGWCYVDIIDPSKRALWIAALKEAVKIALAEPNVDGVFLDNALVPVPGYASIEVEGDPALGNAYYAALVEIVTQLKQEPQIAARYLLLNAYNNRLAASNWRGFELLAAGADGLMREAASIKTNQAFYEGSRLITSIIDWQQMVAGLGLSGPKDLVLLDYINNASDAARRIYSLATYLLVANGRAYHFLSWNQLAWNDVPDFPEHTLDLGAPLSSATQLASGLFERHYAKGTVLLNPYRSDEQPTPVSITIGAQREQLVLQGGGAWSGAGPAGTLAWNPAPSTVALASNTALIYR
jgi:hypothetical protein